MKLYRVFVFFIILIGIVLEDSGNEIVKPCYEHFVNGLSRCQGFIVNWKP